MREPKSVGEILQRYVPAKVNQANSLPGEPGTCLSCAEPVPPLELDFGRAGRHVITRYICGECAKTEEP